MRSYSELIRLATAEERFRYLKLDGAVGEATFGFERYLNQAFYKSKEWLNVRDFVIVRDLGHDMALENDDYEIHGLIIVHHMNTIETKDITSHTENLLNPEYLVCVSPRTHRAIHFGDESQLLETTIVERTPGDTCLWR